MNGLITKIHVDALDEGVFLGAIFLELGSRRVKFDARPSDAIALALGNSAPIFVARDVIEGAAIRADQAANRLDSLLQTDRDGKDPLKL